MARSTTTQAHVATVPLYMQEAEENPAPNFWQRATPARKVAYVAGGVAATAATIYLVRQIVRPKPFASLSAQCNDFALGSRAEVDAAIVPLVRHAAANDDVVDPFAVTTEFLHRFAPDCSTYPRPARNPGEAALYVVSFIEVLRVMEQQRLLSPEQHMYFAEMVSVWGRSQGVASGQLPFNVGAVP